MFFPLPNGGKYFFHRWIIKKGEDGSEEAYALAESLSGQMTEIHFSDVMFE